MSGGQTHVVWACRCGFILQRALPEERVEEVRGWWLETHGGHRPGHGETTYMVAHAVRKRRELEEAEER